MAASKSTNTYNRQNWEDAEFPILCQTCLGDNPYLRMMKERYGSECKICTRPFTIFRWCPGAKMRFKKTEVCQTCAKLKNVCQTCILDLEYGLPVQVRDDVLKANEELPKSDVNREYYLQQADKSMKEAGEDGGGAYGGKISSKQHDVLKKLSRTQPYYKRNRPHICSFWVKGECKRGEECPYRHERPSDPDDPLNDQNIKDRYYGVSDPVAEKIMKKVSSLPALEPPEDASITTIYCGGIDGTFTEADIRDHFYQYGEIRHITMVPKQTCAFVEFTRRSSAEAAADGTFGKLIIKGVPIQIRWGRSNGKQGALEAPKGPTVPVHVPGLPGQLPTLPKEVANNFFNLPTGSEASEAGPSRLLKPPGMVPHAVHYPSQDPSRMGSTTNFS